MLLLRRVPALIPLLLLLLLPVLLLLVRVPLLLIRAVLRVGVLPVPAAVDAAAVLVRVVLPAVPLLLPLPAPLLLRLLPTLALPPLLLLPAPLLLLPVRAAAVPPAAPSAAFLLLISALAVPAAAVVPSAAASPIVPAAASPIVPAAPPIVVISSPRAVVASISAVRVVAAAAARRRPPPPRSRPPPSRSRPSRYAARPRPSRWSPWSPPPRSRLRARTLSRVCPPGLYSSKYAGRSGISPSFCTLASAHGAPPWSTTPFSMSFLACQHCASVPLISTVRSAFGSPLRRPLSCTVIFAPDASRIAVMALPRLPIKPPANSGRTTNVIMH